MRVEKAPLAKAINRLALGARHTAHDSPLMGELGDGKLWLWYPNFDISIWISVPVDGGEGPFIFSIPIEMMIKVLSSFSAATISMDVDDDGALTIRAGKNRVKIQKYEGLFDTIDAIPDGNLIAKIVDSGPMLSSLGDALNFVAKTEERPFLSCVNVSIGAQKMEIVASDSFHMYSNSVSIDNIGEGTFLIPAHSVEILSKLLPKADIDVYQTTNGYVLFRHLDDLAVWVAPFNGQYPNLVPLLQDDGDAILWCPRNSLMDALKIGAILSANNILKLEQKDDSIYVSFPRNVTESDVYLENAVIEGSLEPIYLSIPFLTHCVDAVSGEGLFLGRMKMGAIKIIGSTPSPITMLQIIKYSSVE